MGITDEQIKLFVVLILTVLSYFKMKQINQQNTSLRRLSNINGLNDKSVLKDPKQEKQNKSKQQEKTQINNQKKQSEISLEQVLRKKDSESVMNKQIKKVDQKTINKQQKPLTSSYIEHISSSNNNKNKQIIPKQILENIQQAPKNGDDHQMQIQSPVDDSSKKDVDNTAHSIRNCQKQLITTNLNLNQFLNNTNNKNNKNASSPYLKQQSRKMPIKRQNKHISKRKHGYERKRKRSSDEQSSQNSSVQLINRKSRNRSRSRDKKQANIKIQKQSNIFKKQIVNESPALKCCHSNSHIKHAEIKQQNSNNQTTIILKIPSSHQCTCNHSTANILPSR